MHNYNCILLIFKTNRVSGMKGKIRFVPSDRSRIGELVGLPRLADENE